MNRRCPNLCLPLFSVFLFLGGSLAQTSAAFDRGLAAFRAGNYASAAALFYEAESMAPGTTDALLYRAKALVHLQNFPDAESALRDYAAKHGQSSDALYMLGFVMNREDRPADSLAFYTKAAAITPPSADDLKVVALDYVLLDDYADAIRWLEKAVSFDASNKDAWYYLGRADYATGNLNDARKAFLKVLSLDPHDFKAENNLGLILESSGQPAAAMDAYRTAIRWQEQDSHSSEQPYVNLGNLLMEQGRPEEAQAPLEKAVALAPGNAYCHMTLGMYYRKISRTAEARHELERATQLEPDNAVAHYQLGRLYAEIHESSLARTEFDRTAELKSRAAKARSAATH